MAGGSFPEYPEYLMLVRHGQSAGNIARDEAERLGHTHIPLTIRDVDIPLSSLGVHQANAFGQWLGSQKKYELPEVVIASPYLRAQETARAISKNSKLLASPIFTDERLRERELGALENLTHEGIVQAFPAEAKRYALTGKFYYRPPGGESWCDVILRLRSFYEMLQQEYPGKRILVVCHSVVVLCFRYLIEKMTEAEILKIDSETNLANASLTSYRFQPLQLEHFNFVAPVAQLGEKVTTTPDAAENKI